MRDTGEGEEKKESNLLQILRMVNGRELLSAVQKLEIYRRTNPSGSCPHEGGLSV